VPAKDFHPLDQSFSHYFQDGVGCEMSQATMPGVQVCGRGNFAASADSGTSEYSPSVGSQKMPSGATRVVGGLSTSTQSVQAATQLAFDSEGFRIVEDPTFVAFEPDLRASFCDLWDGQKVAAREVRGRRGCLVASFGATFL